MKTPLHNWNCADCGGWVTEKCCSRVLFETSSQQQTSCVQLGVQQHMSWCSSLGFRLKGCSSQSTINCSHPSHHYALALYTLCTPPAEAISHTSLLHWSCAASARCIFRKGQAARRPGPDAEMHFYKATALHLCWGRQLQMHSAAKPSTFCM